MAIVHESSATSTTATCNKPTGTATGDVLVAVVFSQSGTASATGWVNQVNNNYSSAYYINILTRVVDGSEGSTFTFSGTIIGVGISRFSGVDGTTVIEGTPTSAVNAGGTTVSPGSITTATANAVLVMGAIALASGGTADGLAFSAGTERWDVAGTASSTRLALATELRATAGATGSRTITLSYTGGTPVPMGAMIALKELVTNTPYTAVVPLINAEGTAIVPGVQGKARVAVPTGLAESNAIVPVVKGKVTAAIPTARGEANLIVPAVKGKAKLTTPLINAEGTLHVPGVRARGKAVIPLINGEGRLLIPVVTGKARVVVPVMNGEASVTGVGLKLAYRAIIPLINAEGTAYAPYFGVRPVLRIRRPSFPIQAPAGPSGTIEATVTGPAGPIDAVPAIVGVIRRV